MSVVHFTKAQSVTPCYLDGNQVGIITAFLFHQGGNRSPAKLRANEGLVFEGIKPAGQGFLFDDKDPDCSPVTLMDELLRTDSSNREVIFPYIGGDEITTDPHQKAYRYIIDFYDRSLEKAEEWPALLKIVQEKVKPIRDRANRDAHRKYWWQHGEKRPALREAISGLERVLVISRVSQYTVFAFLKTGIVFSERLAVFAFDTYSKFATCRAEFTRPGLSSSGRVSKIGRCMRWPIVSIHSLFQGVISNPQLISNRSVKPTTSFSPP